jgi:transcriptional regulator with XRE-family HTH domain
MMEKNYFLLKSATGEKLTLAQKINMAIAYKGISQAELARLVGTTPSNFNQRLKRASFSLEELEKIAGALGGAYSAFFEFPDGTRI